ncbi:hypothetical protein [Nocardioides daejeonensis]|uniref:hypothetical protein n=1 Tax=Nocardioides daejeonensis TaxID=1046556 RepID=UPI001EF5CC69|nr:hypothetical protein [Nocardioides daejeonensis]
MRRQMELGTVRVRLAQLVWALCALAAMVLALGALTYALKANSDNGAVTFIRDAAGVLDLGVFNLHNGVKEFSGEAADTKNALFNWGLAAIVWLIIGRIADRLLRP